MKSGSLLLTSLRLPYKAVCILPSQTCLRLFMSNNVYNPIFRTAIRRGKPKLDVPASNFIVHNRIRMGFSRLKYVNFLVYGHKDVVFRRRVRGRGCYDR